MVDSMQRFIYIHGTNEENLLGSPASHGCIRMANQDILALYQYVEVGADVFINAE
jgi:lipoprotein-anchoring transpeptidase ErfK/SrfK